MIVLLLSRKQLVTLRDFTAPIQLVVALFPVVGPLSLDALLRLTELPVEPRQVARERLEGVVHEVSTLMAHLLIATDSRFVYIIQVEVTS